MAGHPLGQSHYSLLCVTVFVNHMANTDQEFLTLLFQGRPREGESHSMSTFLLAKVNIYTHSLFLWLEALSSLTFTKASEGKNTVLFFLFPQIRMWPLGLLPHDHIVGERKLEKSPGKETSLMQPGHRTCPSSPPHSMERELCQGEGKDGSMLHHMQDVPHYHCLLPWSILPSVCSDTSPQQSKKRAS